MSNPKTETPPWTLVCHECGGPLVESASGMICEAGHGRIKPKATMPTPQRDSDVDHAAQFIEAEIGDQLHAGHSPGRVETTVFRSAKDKFTSRAVTLGVLRLLINQSQ
jgi:hypothetical protein